MATKNPTNLKESSTSGPTTKSTKATKPAVPKATKKNYIRVGVAIVAITVALTQNFFRTASTDLGLFLGDIQPFNTAGCEVVPGGLEACEDIHLHRESGLAFMTCGHAEARKDWFPPMAKLNASADDIAFQDKFVIYNVATGKYEEMELAGLPKGTDRVFHGLGIHERSPTELTIFAVNHRRGGSVIEVLEYTIGDKVVQYKETIRHELIHTPNDILATGPRSFYVTNDHKYKSGANREFEELLRRPLSNVIYYSPESTHIAYDHVASANGITSNSDQSLIYLSACHGAGLHILRATPDHTLVDQEYIKLDFYNDNPSYDPDTDSVFVTGHVKPLTLTMGLKKKGVQLNGPSKIVKISKDVVSGGHKVETVLEDDGGLISTGTVSAVDRKRGVMLIGTAFSNRGVVRCPIPQGA
ncbi:calcium-dependent phosphotriesterase [Linnemannia elongata AG-77]|uniref:Calcium-dependent phosphotriesterase n=1 Tax=Linnemannia elongata AG-77 TaxID=1314771 RepID=A0A197K3I2_9FUNG|nr:calcium-dependent phosphotriesterase [Linnemannia elongata AG-77]